LANNLGDLGKIIVATGIEKLPKVQYSAQSGHTAPKLKLAKVGVLIVNK